MNLKIQAVMISKHKPKILWPTTIKQLGDQVFLWGIQCRFQPA